MNTNIDPEYYFDDELYDGYSRSPDNKNPFVIQYPLNVSRNGCLSETMRTAFLGANVIGMNTHDKYTESNIFKKIAAKTMRNSYFLDESLLANIIPTRKGKISKGIKFVITRRIQTVFDTQDQGGIDNATGLACRYRLSTRVPSDDGVTTESAVLLTSIYYQKIDGHLFGALSKGTEYLVFSPIENIISNARVHFAAMLRALIGNDAFLQICANISDMRCFLKDNKKTDEAMKDIVMSSCSLDKSGDTFHFHAADDEFFFNVPNDTERKCHRNTKFLRQRMAETIEDEDTRNNALLYIML